MADAAARNEACCSMAEVNMERNNVIVIAAGPNQIRNKLFNGEPVSHLRWTRSGLKKKQSLQNELNILFSNSESYDEWTAYRTRSGFSTNDEAMMHLLSVHSNDHGRIECNVCRSDVPLRHAVRNSLRMLKNQADDFNQQPYQSTGKVNSTYQLNSHGGISHHASYHHRQSSCKNRDDPFNKGISYKYKSSIHCDPLPGPSCGVAPTCTRNLTSHDSLPDQLPCTSQNSCQHDKTDTASTHKLISHDEDSSRSRHVQPFRGSYTDDQPKENNMNREIPPILDGQKPKVTAFDFTKGRVQRRNCALKEVHQNLKESCSFKGKMRRRIHIWCKQLSRSHVQTIHESKQSLICRHCCYRSTRPNFLRHHYLWSHPRMMSDLNSILGHRKICQSRQTFSTCITNVMLDKKHNSNTSEEGPSMLKPIVSMGIPESHVDIEKEHGVSEGTTVGLSSDGSSCITASPSLSQSHPEDQNAAKHEDKDSLDRTELSGEGKKSKETNRASLPTTIPLVLSQPRAKKHTVRNQSNERATGRRRYQCQYCIHWFKYRQGLWRHIKNAHSEVHYKPHAGAKLAHEVSLGQGNSTTGTDVCTELSLIPVLVSPSKRRKQECISSKPVTTTKSLKQEAVHISPKMLFDKTQELSCFGDSSEKTDTTLSHTPVLPDTLSISQRNDPKHITCRSKCLTGSVSLAAIKEKPKMSLETAGLPVEEDLSQTVPYVHVPPQPSLKSKSHKHTRGRPKGGRKHQCPHCVHWYHFRQNLWRHVKLKHSPITPFCRSPTHNKLEVPFDATKSGVEKSKRDTKRGRKHQCPHCVHWYHFRQNLWRHVKLKHSPITPFCRSPTHNKLEVPFDATKSSVEKSKRDTKTRHTRTTVANIPYPPIQKTRNAGKRSAAKPMKKRHQCPYCVHWFSYRQSLWRHIKNLHSQAHSLPQTAVTKELEVMDIKTEISGDEVTTKEDTQIPSQSPVFSIPDPPFFDRKETQECPSGRSKSLQQSVSHVFVKHEPEVVLETYKLSGEESDKVHVLSPTTEPTYIAQSSGKPKSPPLFVSCNSPTLSRRETKELTVLKRHPSLSNKRKTCSHTAGQCNVQRIKCHYCNHQYNHWQSLWRHVKRNHGLIRSRSQMAIKRESIKTTELTDEGNGFKAKSSSSVAHVLVSTSQQKDLSITKNSPKHKESKYLCTKCTNTYRHQQSLHRHVNKKHGKAQRLSDEASKQGPDVSIGFIQTSGKDHCNISAVMSPIPTIPFPSPASHQGLWKNAPNNHSLLTQEEVPLEIAEFSCEGHSYYECVIPMSSGTCIWPHVEVDNGLSQPLTEATIKNLEDSLKTQ